MPPETTPTSSAARVTAARPEQLESLIDCHVAALPGDYLPRLGRGLVRLHDRFYLDESGGVCLVTLDAASGRVTGFVIGGDPRLRGRFVRRHWAPLLAAILMGSVRDAFVRRHTAGIVAGAARALLRRLRLAPPAREIVPDEPAGTWGVSIVLGTHPEFRTGGATAAIALLEGIHRECARLGYTVTRAMTSTANTTSHLLHTRLGWKVVGVAGGFYHYRREVEPGAD